MTHNSQFDESILLYTHAGFYLFYIEGDIGQFSNIAIDVIP